MVLPIDWDKPSKDNARLCRKFSFHSFQSNGLSLPYRLFTADTDERVPLVVYLHGADAVGSDNEQPLAMHDIGTMFARASWQRNHPCHIVAPQYGHGMHWSTDAMDAAVDGLVRELCGTLPVGRSRVYIYGYSAGGVGTLRYCKEHPGTYAAALAICGATGKSNLERLKDIPLWMVHAADDGIVKATYRDERSRELYHFGSRDIYEAIGDDAPLLHYTEFPAGYMKAHYHVNPHCSWVAVSDRGEAGYGEWLFGQRKTNNGNGA